MKPPRIFTQLGRVGDILNVLPLLKRYKDETGETPYLQVAVEFASILDGVSYCKPLLWMGPWDRPLEALAEARKYSSDLVLCQIHGAHLCNPRCCDSFAREAWLSAGADVPWGSLPLVFDQRSPEREAKIAPHAKGREKLVLYAGMGKSSPFPFSRALLRKLQSDLPDGFAVLDLSAITAERFYDLLGLFEIAHCLITIDTAHQHLAHAVPTLPVIALVTRDPDSWHGSPWRPQQIARYFYDEFPLVMDDLVRNVIEAHSPQPKIIHVWADWRTNMGPESARRINNAKASWAVEYATGRWIPREVLRSDCTRDGTELGDPHNVNYTHDTIEIGVKAATSDQDIIALTNADIGFTPGLTGRILEQIARHGAAFTHRRDHQRIDRAFVSEAQVKQGEFYPGTDAFFFTVGWWKEHKHELGDSLMGREFWDETFRQLMKYHGAGYIPHAVWHEWHESHWSGEGRWTLPGNVHNSKLRDKWFERTGFIPYDFRYFRVVEGGDEHPKPYPREPFRGP